MNEQLILVYAFFFPCLDAEMHLPKQGQGCFLAFETDLFRKTFNENPHS